MSILISNDPFWRGDIEKITGAQLCKKDCVVCLIVEPRR